MNDGLGDLFSFSNKEDRRADPRRQSTAIFSSFTTETRGDGFLNVDDELYLGDEDILLPLSKAISQHSHDNPGGGTLWLDPDLDDEMLAHTLPDLPEEEGDKEEVHKHNNIVDPQQQHSTATPKTSSTPPESSTMETLQLDEDDESFLLKDENKVKEMAILFKMSSMEVSDTVKEHRLSSHPLPDFIGPTDEEENVEEEVNGNNYVDLQEEEEMKCDDNDDHQKVENKYVEEEGPPSVEGKGDDNQNINSNTAPSNISCIETVTTKNCTPAVPVVQKQMPKTTTRSKLKPPTALSTIKAHRPLATTGAAAGDGGRSVAAVEEEEVDNAGRLSPSSARLRFLEQHPELVFGGGSKKVGNSPNARTKNGGGGEGNVKRRTALERQWMEWDGQPL